MIKLFFPQPESKEANLIPFQIMTMTEWSLGLDIGSVAIKVVLFKLGQLQATDYRFHYGDISGCLQSILSPWLNLKTKLALTGSGAQVFPHEFQVDEIVAAIEGTKWALGHNYRSLLIIGGERIYLIELDPNGIYRRHVTNSDCASGTGSFLEQQAGRLALSLEEFEKLAYNYEGEIPAIASRCSVFALTDLIHRQQEGYSIASLAAGISRGVARAIADAIIKGRKLEPPLYVAGGGSIHRRLLSFLEELLQLEVKPVPRGHLAIATGAALLASGEVLLDNFLSLKLKTNSTGRPLNPPLKIEKPHFPERSSFKSWEEDGLEIDLFTIPEAGSTCPALLGLDIGSTSTKLVLTDKKGSIILGLYTRTAGKPIEATQRLFRWLDYFSQKRSLNWQWCGVATTGSGRALIGQLIGADLIINEITAHARSARTYLPDVDTVIEIGGQDSKFIRLQDGNVVQSVMNTICAAGTGSFLEQQAQKLGVPLSAYNELTPGICGPAISDRCTVYMERDLSRLLAEGWSKEQLLASALHSVRDNYLIRVVGQAKIGNRICFQGATARNRGLIVAFEAALNKTIYVSPFPHLAGALGAALLVGEMHLESSKFVGLNFGYQPLEQRIETCDLCPNNCRIMVVWVGSARAAWGFQCGREYEEKRKRHLIQSFFSKAEAFPSSRQISKSAQSSGSKEKIGLPLILPLTETQSFWQNFFRELGFETVTPALDEEVLERGQNIAKAEFCAPIYLAHGQVERLFNLGYELVFFPVFVEGPDQNQFSNLPNFYCYYTGYLPVVLRHSVEMGKGKLLSPVINWRWPDKKNVSSLVSVLKKIGLKEREIYFAWQKAKSAWQEERKKKIEQGEAVIESFPEGKWAVVLLGRSYNLDNSLLNQNLPEIMANYGLVVLRQEMIKGLEEEKGTDFIHWHYGKIIMQAARRVAADNRLFAVFISNFRCSPDSFLLTYFRDLMERAHKPYLILQLDGLNSDIGYRTRIEAALESFRHWKPRKREREQVINFISLQKNRIWIVPHVDDTASALATACLKRFGYEALLARENQETIYRGLGMVGGGECLPTAALIGSFVETIEKEKISPSKAALAIPTSLLSCNFPQIPVLIKLILEKIGLGEVEIFTTALVGQREPAELSFMLFNAYCLADNLRRLVSKIRPYEKYKGETEDCWRRQMARLSRAIEGRLNLTETFREVIQEFASIPVEREESRPKVAIIGDLYVIANPEFNLRVEKEVEACGGEVIPASLIDITHFGHLNRLSKAWKNRSWSELFQTALLHLLLELKDRRWRKMIEEVIDQNLAPLSLFSLRKLREIGIPPELEGETAMNLAKIEHYCRELKIDAFLHVNPIYCCPGVVTVPLLSWLEEKLMLPVINLYYDGLHNPNDQIRPYLYFLRQKNRRQFLSEGSDLISS